MSRPSHGLALLVAVLALGGCHPLFLGGVAAPKMLQQEKVNLLNSSYAAMDVLVQQSQGYYSVGTPLTVSDPVEMPDLERKQTLENRRIGEILATQYVGRLTQLGYDAKRGPAGAHKGLGHIEGVFQIKTGDFTLGKVWISLRMLDANGKVVGRHDYSLPLTYDVKRYMTRGKDQMPPMPPLF